MKMKRPRKVEEDLSDYQLTDSDYDFDENEKILLEGARKKQGEKVEDEVFGLPQWEESEDDDDDGDDDFEKDVADDDDGLPSSKAWGQHKKAYYNTDYVDRDYGGFRGKDAELAEYEEKEASTIQERLVKEIDEADYMLEIFETKTSVEEPQDVEVEEKVLTDLTSLSKRQKRELFKKDSPEFAALVEDYKAKMSEVHEKLEPMLAVIEEGKVPVLPLCSFVKTKYHLILNYCTNIVFYLLLKSRRIPVQPHPVIQRLFQFRQLLKQLEDIDEVVLAQIDEILEKVNNGEELRFKEIKETVSTPKQKKKKTTDKKVKKEEEETLFFKAARLPVAAFGSNDDDDDDDNKDDDDDMEVDEMGDDDMDETLQLHGEGEYDEGGEDEEQHERRKITYQIAKNKGLTPRRKKEQRNPRVKHRNKFRKATIRRKGQVREVRRELKKYGGEISGIKIGITKSIKLK